MFCKQCGNEIKEGQKFCSVCGSPAPTETVDPVETVESAQPQQPEYQQVYQPEYQQTSYQPQAEQPRSQTNGLAIASLVLGIFGVLCDWAFGLGFILGIAALVLYSQSKKKYGPSGMATAGLVLGIISVVCGLLVLSCTVCVGGAALMSLY